MDIVKFEEISDFLKTGREIEFDYNGRKYYVVNHDSYWHLGCNNKNILTLCPFHDKDTLVDMVATFSIDGVTIKDVFNDLKYDLDSLCIL